MIPTTAGGHAGPGQRSSPTHSVDLAEVEANHPLQVRNPSSAPFVPLGIQFPHLPEHFVERDIASGLQTTPEIDRRSLATLPAK